MITYQAVVATVSAFAACIEICGDVVIIVTAADDAEAFAVAASQAAFAFIGARTAVVVIDCRIDANAAAICPAVHGIAIDALAILNYKSGFTGRD